MPTSQLITTKELRDNLSEILEKVAIGKQSFTVSKFGRKKANITPINTVKKKNEKNTGSVHFLESLIKLNIKGGPKDLSKNIDHYLYGAPKKK